MVGASERLRDLVWMWDPLDLGDARSEIADEYDSLIFETIDLLALGVETERIAVDLVSTIARSWSGLSGHDALRAEKLMLPAATSFVSGVAAEAAPSAEER